MSKCLAVDEMGDRLATIDMGRNWESPCNTMWPTFVPNGILIHPAVWPQQTWAEKWGRAVLLFSRELSPIYHSVAWAEAYIHTKWHLDPSSRLPTTDMG